MFLYNMICFIKQKKYKQAISLGDVFTFIAKVF